MTIAPVGPVATSGEPGPANVLEVERNGPAPDFMHGPCGPEQWATPIAYDDVSHRLPA
jgi:hypothetical protein